MTRDSGTHLNEWAEFVGDRLPESIVDTDDCRDRDDPWRVAPDT